MAKLCVLNIIIVLILNFHSLVLITGFKNQDRNLVEALQSMDYTVGTFYRLVHEARLADKLANEGPFTLLVPTNEAFAALNPSFLNGVRTDVGRLRALLQGHILPGSMMLSSLRDGVSLVSLLGDKIFFTVSRRGVSINGSFVSVADLKTKNGVIHIIDRVLVLDSDNGFGNVMESIADKLHSSEFLILRNLLHEARLYDILSKGGPFTLFAPTDKAFSVMNPDFLYRLRNDQTSLRAVLLQHIVPRMILFPDRLRSEFVKSLNGKALWLSSGREGQHVNGSLVLEKDIRASNGVIHVIQNILIPPDQQRIIYPVNEVHRLPLTVMDALRNNGLKAFVKLINHVSLTQIFNLDGPFTIFAPTDVAFAALDTRLTEILSKNLDVLRDVILHHVVRGFVFEKELSKGWEGFALNGENLYSSYLGDKISVSGSTVIFPRIKASNGIVYIVDQVILPTSAQAYIPLLRRLDDKGLRLFGQLLSQAGLSNDYFNEDPHTTFIPSDDAFQSLNPLIRSRLQNDPHFLRRVMLYHTIPGTLYPEQIQHSQTLPTALGGPFRVRVDHEPLRIRNIKDQLHLEDLSVMWKLIEEAKIMSMLMNKGPYTIFMPTDSAFHSYDPHYEDRFLRDPNHLQDFVSYHVLPGRFSLTDLANQHQLRSMNGLPLRIRRTNMIPAVNGARFLEHDIATGIGNVNVIDRVLIPPQRDIADTLLSNSDLSTIAKIWDSYGLLDVLRNGSDLTLFVPHNSAFFKSSLNSPYIISPEKAESLLQRHLLFELDGPCYAIDLCWREAIFSDGTKVRMGINIEGQIILHTPFKTAHVIQENVEATNGIIHIIDEVL